jgi:[acyl-carrier-protein] S-malonyltransferase
MGRDLYETFPEAKDVFDRADEALGFALTQVMFGNGRTPEAAADELKRTQFTQPALFVHSLAADAVLRTREIRPEAAAGHSLGEYSALVAASAISFEDGLRIVSRRGELMAGAGRRRNGSMAAIIGLDDETVRAICKASSGIENTVVPANYNSEGQIVISGDVPAIERAVARAMEAGALKAVVLPVGGAFHSPLMEEARTGLAEALREVPISEPDCPVYSNVTATPTSDPEEIRKRLIDQLTAPVLWTQIMHAMRADGIVEFVEVGSGRVLSGLIRRALGREIKTAQAGSAADFSEIHETTPVSRP